MVDLLLTAGHVTLLVGALVVVMRRGACCSSGWHWPCTR